MHSRSGSVASEECAPLVAQARGGGHRYHDPQSERNLLVTNAIYTFTPLLAVVALELIIPLTLLFINLFIGFAIPFWVSFLIICFGHVVYVFLIYGACQSLSVSMNPPASQPSSSQSQPHNESADFTMFIQDEGRIVLIKYLLDNFTWTILCYLMFLVTQVLVYLAVVGVVTPVSFLIPIYIVISSFLGAALLCRYAHILQTLTLLCLLTALILYNIKLYHADAFAWNIVFVPMLALCAMWLIVLLSITMGSAVSYYKLQMAQFEALFHYILADVAFIIAFRYLGLYLNDGHFGSFTNLSVTQNLRVSVGLLLLGAISLSVAFLIDVHAFLETHVYRMGAARPLELVRAAHGGWEVDADRNCHNYLILGEVELNDPKEAAGAAEGRSAKPSSRSFLLGCCVSTVELMGRRYSFYEDDEDDSQTQHRSRFNSFQSFPGSVSASRESDCEDGANRFSYGHGSGGSGKSSSAAGDHGTFASHVARSTLNANDAGSDDLSSEVEDSAAAEEDFVALLSALEDGVSER